MGECDQHSASNSILATAHAPKTSRFDDTRERVRSVGGRYRERMEPNATSGARTLVPSDRCQNKQTGEGPGREGVPEGRTSAGNGVVWEISERSSDGYPGGSHPVGAGGDGLRRGAVPGRPGQVGPEAGSGLLRRFPAPGKARGKALSSSPALCLVGAPAPALRRAPEMPTSGSSVTTWVTRPPHTAPWVLRAHGSVPVTQ